MSAGRSMQIATGETRPIRDEDVAPDGSFLCPWCRSPNPAGREQCCNPACWASVGMTPELVRVQQEELAERELQEVERKASWDLFERYLREQREQEHALWRELTVKAQDQGSCLECLRKSYWRSGRPRFVRHRKPDFHGESSPAL